MSRASLVITWLVLAGVAHAEPAHEPSARELYEEGARRYNLAEYDDAISAFKEAYRRSNSPSVLYNIAQAYRKKGPSGCAQALEFYRSYLRERPDADDRDTVYAQIDEMNTCATAERARADAARSEAARAEAARLTTTPIAERRRPTRAQWALGGVGLGVLVGGFALLGVAGGEYHALTHQCPCDPGRWRPYRDVEIASYPTIAVGGVTLIVAGAWWLATRHRPTPTLSLATEAGR
jgi:tetratricopeptide (TPR) repeat protein